MGESMGTGRRPVPAHSEPGLCKFCCRPIAWYQTPRGKWMPIDAEPSDAGNVVLRYTRSSAELTAVVLKKDEPARVNERIFMPHMASCPRPGR